MLSGDVYTLVSKYLSIKYLILLSDVERRVVYNRTILNEVVEIKEVKEGLEFQERFKNIKLKLDPHLNRNITDGQIKR